MDCDAAAARSRYESLMPQRGVFPRKLHSPGRSGPDEECLMIEITGCKENIFDQILNRRTWWKKNKELSSVMFTTVSWKRDSCSDVTDS